MRLGELRPIAVAVARQQRKRRKTRSMIDNRGEYSRFWSRFAAALRPGLSLPGCSGASDDLPRQPLAGRVLLDGKPLAHGTIMFYPEEVSTKQHETVPTGNTIVNGWFSDPARQRAGARQVQDRGVIRKESDAPGSNGPGRQSRRGPRRPPRKRSPQDSTPTPSSRSRSRRGESRN